MTKDGQPFSNQNFNFWGVTFADDDDHFYASLGSGSVHVPARGQHAGPGP